MKQNLNLWELLKASRGLPVSVPMAKLWGYQYQQKHGVSEISGVPPLRFMSRGGYLQDCRIYGNTVQNGTPSPQAPVDVVGCGVWDETQQSYKLPLTVNGTEYPIYLEQVETTRKIRKLVFDGTEKWQTYGSVSNTYRLSISNIQSIGNSAICSHFVNSPISEITSGKFTVGTTWIYIRYADVADLADFKSYLAAQYAAGTPVTVWYVLATPETAIVNEPLQKIGDYSDELSIANVPTINGINTISADTTVQPSNIWIKGKIKAIN